MADSAIEKMLSFSSEEYVQEWEAKKKREDEYYEQKKVIIGSDIKQDIVIDARDSEYIWCRAEIMAIIEAKNEDNGKCYSDMFKSLRFSQFKKFDFCFDCLFDITYKI